MLVPLVEHVHTLRVFHPFPHQQLLPLYTAADPIEHRNEHYEHAQQPQLRHGMVVDKAGYEDAQSYPRLRRKRKPKIT